MIRAYHFVGEKLRDGQPIPADGVWLEHSGRVKICHEGLHASVHVADALSHAPGRTLCLVELDGVIDEGTDKLAASRRRIIARFDATELLREDARASALSVIHLWNPPAIVLEYLQTGCEGIRVEARKAAIDAYDAAAADAATDAADAAADAAAYAAAATDAAATDAAAYAAAAAAADAAYAAAAAAAYAAAAYAAYAAAAAYDAARKQHREQSRSRLLAAVEEKFREMGVL